MNGCTQTAYQFKGGELENYLDKLSEETFYCKTVNDCAEVYIECNNFRAINKNYFTFEVNSTYECYYLIEACSHYLDCENNRCVVKYNCQ